MADGYIRSKSGFTAVQNTVAKNKNLSLKAKGLYLVIQAHITIPNSSYKKSDFFNKVCEGEKAFENTWNELKEAGYLKTHIHTKGGKFITEYELLDEEQSGAHTFYYDKDDKLSKTNLDKKPVSENESDEPKTELSRIPQKGGTVKEDSRIPQNGSNGNGTNGNGIYGNGSNGNGGNNNNTNSTLQEINSISKTDNKTVNNTHHHQEQSPDSILNDDEGKTSVEEMIRNNIEFERLLREHPVNRELLENILHVMCELYLSSGPEVFISKKHREDLSVVREHIGIIRYDDIKFLLNQLPDIKDCNIVNPDSFMRTCIFNLTDRSRTVCWTRQIKDKKSMRHEYDFEAMEKFIRAN